MKKHILSLILLVASCYVGQCDLSAHIILQYSRMDNTLWECKASTPQISTQVGVGLPVGTVTNVWKGHSYWVDVNNNTLIKDGTTVGPLLWGTNIWDVQRFYGFVISQDGVGWLASQDTDDNIVSFLLSVDLTNACVTVVGPLGDPPFNPNIANGLQIAYQLPTHWVTSNGMVSVVADYLTDPVMAVTNLPSLYLNTLTDDDWFGQTNGIYANTMEETWAKQCDIKYINPDGSINFARQCEVEIAGCSSRDPVRIKKHSLNVKFKSATGGVLTYPIFGPDAAPTFKSLRLAAGNNITWACNFDSQAYRAQYVRDQYANDLQLLMGYASVHGKFVHLYINDIYWGIYGIREKPDEDWCKSYYGGNKNNYDVIKNTCVGTEIVAGTNTSYNLMLSFKNDYEQMKQHLDIDAFIDYMILNFYIGNTDWALHNWYAYRDRTITNFLWRYVNWDSEYTLLNLNDNVTGKNDGDPTTIHSFLRNSAEYRNRFARRAAYQFNQGVLLNPLQPYMNRINEIDQSIVLESARWGDSTGVLYTRNNWLTELSHLTNTYFPNRSAVVISQLRTGLLYPTLPPHPSALRIP